MGEILDMDYIYSCLNDDVASREMHGSETNTAVVTVNVATNTISVDVKPISPSMLNVTKPTETGSYILQETISEIGEVSYSWATLEDYNQEVTQAIANLTQQLEQEKQERIESVQAEANTRELADTQLRTEFTSEIAQEKQEREQAVSKEAQRTDSMIKQLNGNVQEGFNTINNVLTTSINNINNAILNESTVREEQYQDTEFRIRDLNTRLGVEIDNREREDGRIHASLSANIEKEKMARIEQDQDIRNSISAEANLRQEAFDELSNKISSEANRTDNMINQLNNNVQEGFNILNTVLIDSINTINGGIEEERQTRATADETLQSNIDAEANAREEADSGLDERITAIEATGVLGAHLEGKTSVNVQSEAGRTFNIDLIDSSDSNNEDKFAITLDNNDVIAGYSNDKSKSHKIAMVSKWGVVEIGATDAPLNLSTSANKVTVNDTYKLLDDRDKVEINSAINAETNRATQAEADINGRIDTAISNANHAVIDSVSINITSGNTATLEYTTYNPGTGAEGEISSVAIPMADSTTAGLMSSAHVNDIDNSVKKNGVAEQTVNGTLNISGNVTLGGNLHVQGKTVTVDTETLNVTDNLIVTNSGGTDLEYPSGLAIKTNSNSAFGIVYDPAVDELKAGIGSIDESNEFGFNEGEGNPVTLRSSDTELTDGNILVWTNIGHKLIDSGIPATQIARKDQEQTFSGEQTFANVVATNVATTELFVNGVELQANVSGNIAVESQITDAIDNLVNGASTGYQNLGEVEATVSAINTDLQEFKTSTNQNITQIEDDLASEGNRITQAENNISGINSSLSQMNSAIQSAQSCATNAYSYAGEANTLANTANTRANEAYDLASDANTLANSANKLATDANNAITTHTANTNNPHAVNATQVGLGNVKNIDTTNASNINSGTLAKNIIADGLIVSGNSSTTTVTKNSETGAYTVTAIVNKENVGLGNVDNTSDLDKPVSTATNNVFASVNACIAEVTTTAGNAYSQANEAMNIATNANTNIANHIANINNPHKVTKAQLGLSNVADVDTTNATNITTGYLAKNRIAEGLLVAEGTNVNVSRNSESGVYTISATTGAVTLNTLTFTGACNAKYNGASDVTVDIPTVPPMHSVNLSTNNGSASAVIGNVYSNSATPIEISIPKISVVRGEPTGSGVAVVDIQVTTDGNVVTITPVLGPVNDGTL